MGFGNIARWFLDLFDDSLELFVPFACVLSLLSISEGTIGLSINAKIVLDVIALIILLGMLCRVVNKFIIDPMEEEGEKYIKREVKA